MQSYLILVRCRRISALPPCEISVLGCESSESLDNEVFETNRPDIFGVPV